MRRHSTPAVRVSEALVSHWQEHLDLLVRLLRCPAGRRHAHPEAATNLDRRKPGGYSLRGAGVVGYLPVAGNGYTRRALDDQGPVGMCSYQPNDSVYAHESCTPSRTCVGELQGLILELPEVCKALAPRELALHVA